MRRILTFAALAYLIVSVWGAVIAVERELPHSLFGGGSISTIDRDALVGWGTALAPPATFMAVVLVVTVVAGYGGNALWPALMVVLGVAGLVHALMQETVRDTLGNLATDTTLSTLVSIQLAAAVLVALLGAGISLGDRELAEA